MGRLNLKLFKKKMGDFVQWEKRSYILPIPTLRKKGKGGAFYLKHSCGVGGGKFFKLFYLALE